jgi:hypothetical protein
MADKYTQINVKDIPETLKDEAERVARANDRNLSQVIRDLLRLYVDTNGSILKGK